MGFFNTLQIYDNCPNCGKRVFLTIQFKYGENWMHDYKIGDDIIWGQSNIGEKLDNCILVSAISEECPICNECSDYIVKIEKNVIQQVYADKIQLSAKEEGYCIIEG